MTKEPIFFNLSDPWIPLHKAILCLDCELVHTKDICPRCASTQNHPIVEWIEEKKLTTKFDPTKRRIEDGVIRQT